MSKLVFMFLFFGLAAGVFAQNNNNKEKAEKFINFLAEGDF